MNTIDELNYSISQCRNFQEEGPPGDQCVDEAITSMENALVYIKYLEGRLKEDAS